jgi:serine/threonine protein kinase
MALIVEGKYRLDRKIGEGAFGKIYAGINKNTGEEVAVKIERCCDSSPLRNEARIYTALRGIKGIPMMRSWGTEGKFNYLAIDLLGESLEQRRISYGGKMDVKYVMEIGIQMLERIRDIHQRGLIHRDVKPGNFIFGTRNSEQNIIYVIDFGLTKVYFHNNKHILLKRGRSMLGTARFASLNVHDGLSPSRRDDIESLGYIIVYLLMGELPWQHVDGEDVSMVTMKRSEGLWELLRECGVSSQVILFMKYSRGLRYAETPDYDYLFGLLNGGF